MKKRRGDFAAALDVKKVYLGATCPVIGWADQKIKSHEWKRRV